MSYGKKWNAEKERKMKFSVTGVNREGHIEKRTVESSTKHDIEDHKLSYGFVSIINIKQLQG